jgi:D-alanyl-D-alanine carboxypeptidase
VAAVLGAAAMLVFVAPRAAGPEHAHSAATAAQAAQAARATQAAPAAKPSPPVGGASTVSTGNAYGSALAPVAERFHVKLLKRLKSGIVFDVDSGRVLWQRSPQQVVPIASLTKMMTALVVADRASLRDKVLITRQALAFSGSGVGLLPLGRHVPLETMLYGLMLPSGNDAAIALAQHVAGTEQRFIAMMNDRAVQMGLRCTHFTSDSGIVDQGNYSCASDLAVLAHAVLTQPLLHRIVASRQAVLPFPIKGGKLYLYNNNPLLRMGFPGTDGVKTGYTTLSGPCLVASAHRGRRWLAVVLLDSADPPDQAKTLLDAGFAASAASHL